MEINHTYNIILQNSKILHKSNNVLNLNVLEEYYIYKTYKYKPHITPNEHVQFTSNELYNIISETYDLTEQKVDK